MRQKTGDEANPGRYAALAAASRRHLLEVLTAAEGPMGVDELAAAVGLHVTTARHHLQMLERARYVERAAERAGRPGRPRVLYTAPTTAPGGRGHRELAEVLSAAFGDDPDAGRSRAERAGERWAAEAVPAADAAGPDGPEHAIAELHAVFDRLGFAPRHHSSGREHQLLLDACPFRDIARAHPEVVCSVHLGLLRGILHRRGVVDAETELRPFVEPELCIAAVRLAPAGPSAPTTD